MCLRQHLECSWERQADLGYFYYKNIGGLVALWLIDMLYPVLKDRKEQQALSQAPCY